jgi:hypothetical protein
MTNDNKTFVCAHKHKTLSMLSLTAGNTAQLCGRILGIPVVRKSESFITLKLYHT